MAPETKEILQRLLKQFATNQPFTVGELTRLCLKEQGHDWQHVYEIVAQDEIEKFLKEQELVQEFGKTTLYTITKKVNEQ